MRSLTIANRRCNVRSRRFHVHRTLASALVVCLAATCVADEPPAAFVPAQNTPIFLATNPTQPSILGPDVADRTMPPIFLPPILLASPSMRSELPPAFVPMRVARLDESSSPLAEQDDLEPTKRNPAHESPPQPLPTIYVPADELIPSAIDPSGDAELPIFDDPSDDLPTTEELTIEELVIEELHRLPQAEKNDNTNLLEIGSPSVSSLSIGSPPITSPSTFPSWWDELIGKPMRPAADVRYVSINELISAALRYSSRIQIVSTSPLITDTAIIEADSEFDWVSFMETSWNDLDEPVGNSLTTGGPPRFQDEKLSYENGARRKTASGGQFEASQQYGYERSNSVFFLPNDQGTSRLTLNFTQPLLRGSGRPFNTSTIVLAQLQSGVARDEFSRLLQAHLLDVTESYWALYLERGTLLQRQRLFKRGQIILQDLEYRRDMDAIQNQIVRVRAAVESRRSKLFRAAAQVKNAEGRLRALVNDPALGMIDEFELTPIDLPATFEVQVSIPNAIQCAFQNRPEIAQAVKQVKASGVRLDVAKNELLPLLDVFAEMYVSGLQGSSAVGGALKQQFGDGAPSYSTGLRFELPFGNRASRARFQRRVLEQRQFQHRFQNSLQSLQLEVEIAARETITSFREISAKHQSLTAAEGEVAFLTQRWKLLPGDDRSVSLLLEDVLSAQDRLATQEFDFLNAQVLYNIALVNLRKVTGTLLKFERIAVSKSETSGVPQLHLRKEPPLLERMPNVAVSPPPNGTHPAPDDDMMFTAPNSATTVATPTGG